MNPFTSLNPSSLQLGWMFTTSRRTSRNEKSRFWPHASMLTSKDYFFFAAIQRQEFCRRYSLPKMQVKFVFTLCRCCAAFRRIVNELFRRRVGKIYLYNRIYFIVRYRLLEHDIRNEFEYSPEFNLFLLVLNVYYRVILSKLTILNEFPFNVN